MLKSPRIGEEPVDERPLLSREPGRGVRGNHECRNRGVRAIPESVCAKVPPVASDAGEVRSVRAIHPRLVVDPHERAAGEVTAESVSLPADGVVDVSKERQIGSNGNGDRQWLDPQQGREVAVRGVLPGGTGTQAAEPRMPSSLDV